MRLDRIITLLIALIICSNIFANPDSLISLASGINTNFRGVSIAQDQSIWVSGSNGYIGRASSLQSDWKFFQINEFETAELRDIYAIDSLHAIVMSCTQPATILKTDDGGLHWRICYQSNLPDAFLDGFDFWKNSKGICMGDPVDNKFLILTTSDMAETWKELHTENLPKVADSIYAFAASGTGIQCLENGIVYFGTGGNAALLYKSVDWGNTWQRQPTPLISGTESSGIFSIDFSSKKYKCITGGDYASPKNATNNFCLMKKNGKWITPDKFPDGYMSCVKIINNNKVITCGINGVDIASTKSFEFIKISNEEFNTIAFDNNSGLVILAGSNGKIAILNY
ncbi:MAG: hypothetical protein KA954_00690 [Chitinophagales bacterium]|nr:hypothetical protein [Chitinophagales bacterium]MBP9188165.1 hypothetical protein [Chitinophagales bacterium]